MYFTAEDSGNEKLYSVRLGGGAVQTLFGVGEGARSPTSRFPSRAGKTLLYANWESASAPGEIALVSPLGGKALVLTSSTRTRAAQLDLPPIENFWFTSSRGKHIHSFLVRPPGFDATKKYPLFVVIHGGPHGMWRDQFFVRWNYHLLAAPGYVLLLTNYSGSTGFGEEFARSIQGDPLKGPADEINEAADAAIKAIPLHRRQPAMRRRRKLRRAPGELAAGHDHALQVPGQPRRPGQSRGAMGHQRHHLLARGEPGRPTLGAGRGVARAESDPLCREVPHAGAVTVGENDFRVPLNNSLEYWSALQRMQVPSRLIVFPDENHWILKGEDSRLFYAEISAWLARWLEAGEPPRSRARLSDEWDFYFARVNDAVSSIFVDLGIRRRRAGRNAAMAAVGMGAVAGAQARRTVHQRGSAQAQ